jgi:hypothetical protein
MGYRPDPPPRDPRQRIYWLEHDTETVTPGGHVPDDGCGVCLWHRLGWGGAPEFVLQTMAEGCKPMGPPPRTPSGVSRVG